MIEYLIPEEFIKGSLYIKIDTVEHLIEFLNTCATSGLNVNFTRTLTWSQLCMKKGHTVYLSNQKDSWAENNETYIVMASWLRHEPLNCIHINHLTVNNFPNLETILDLL